MSLSDAIYSGQNISTATTISPEKLDNALTAKRKALAVFQSESSEMRKKRKRWVVGEKKGNQEKNHARLDGYEVKYGTPDAKHIFRPIFGIWNPAVES